MIARARKITAAPKERWTQPVSSVNPKVSPSHRIRVTMAMTKFVFGSFIFLVRWFVDPLNVKRYLGRYKGSIENGGAERNILCRYALTRARFAVIYVMPFLGRLLLPLGRQACVAGFNSTLRSACSGAAGAGTRRRPFLATWWANQSIGAPLPFRIHSQ
jgi:hypothetical protein